MNKQREVARASLRRQLIERTGDGTLRDLDAVVCENGVEIAIYALWSTDEPCVTSIRDRYGAHTFDHGKFLRWFTAGGGSPI